MAEDAQQAIKAFSFVIERAEYSMVTSIGADPQIADLLALAVCRSMRNDDKKADQLLTEIDQSYPTAVVRPRAMFMRAVWLIGSSQKNGEEKGLAILAGVWKRYPTSEEGASALSHIGWLAVKSGKPTEAKTALQAYLSQYPRGPYRNAARSYLHQNEIDKTAAKSADTKR